MKRLALIGFIWFLIFSVSNMESQTTRGDSLLAALSIAKNDTSKVKILIKLSDVYAQSNVPLSLDYSEKAIALSKELKFNKGILMSGMRKASAVSNTGKFKESFKILNEFELFMNKNGLNSFYGELTLRRAYLLSKSNKYRESIETFLKVDSVYKVSKYTVGQIECQRSIAGSYAALGEYEQAINYCNKGISLADTAKDERSLGDCYLMLGNIFSKQFNFVKSISEYEKALIHFTKANSLYNIAGCYISLGNCYLFIDNYQKAKENYLKCLEIRALLKDKSGMAYVNQNLGIIAFKQSQFDEAAKYYYDGLKLSEEMRDPTLLVGSLSNVAQLELARSNYKLSASYADRAVKEAQKNGFKEHHWKALSTLSKANYFMKNYKEAYIFKDSCDKIKDQLINANSAKLSLEMEEKFQSQKKESELRENKLSLTLSEEQLRSSNRQKIVVTVVLIIVLLFAILLYNRYKITQQQKAIIEGQKKIVEAQKKLVEEKQKEILDSIHYARRIQMAQIPSEKQVAKNLKRLRK